VFHLYMAFMQVNDTVHVKMEVSLAELLVKIDPKLYRKYLSNGKGRPVLYVRPKHFIALKVAMLFWRALTTKLVDMGFEINPYDRCAANKLIDGRQSSTLWQVDGIKVSH